MPRPQKSQTNLETKDTNYIGRCHVRTHDIQINLTKIARRCKTEQGIIRLFSKALQHEMLHREIGLALQDLGISIEDRMGKYAEGEEYVVRRMCNQSFGKATRKAYRNTW